MAVISPHRLWLHYWTVVLTGLLVYLCATIPLILAFGKPDFGGVKWVIIMVADIVTELAFITDIFLNFHIVT
jgi:hypothetical protein